MQRLQYFNRMLPVIQDFLTHEELSIDSISSRWLDRTSWGIVRRNSFMSPLVIPVSPTADVPNNAWDIAEFTFVFDTENGKVSIGAGSSSSSNPRKTGGVAYDVNGERIAIEDDAVFDFSNDIPEGKKSSGNIDIPLTLTGTSGGCATNPSQFGTYYFWIEYLETNDPTYSDIAKDASVHYPKILDGYRIRMTSDPVAPSGDGVSVFLAKVVWTVSFPGTLTVFEGTADQDGNGNLVSTVPNAVTGEPNRVYSLVRDRQLEIQIDTDNDRTQTYAKGMRLSVHEHVNAVGSADPTASNPHGLTLDDIPGGTSEPKATIAFKEGLSKGLVDLVLDNNSPVFQTDAALCTIENSDLQPSGLDVTAIIGTGVNSAQKRAWVRVSDLDTNQSAYVSGTRLKRLYPTLRNTTDHTSDASIDPSDPDSGDGWIGFSDQLGFADPAGTYRLIGQLVNVAGTDCLFLRKVQLDDSTLSLPALGFDELELGLVYWDGSNLWHDFLRNEDVTVVERRSTGLVGPGQISTDAKADAEVGILSRVVLENRIGNSQFQFDKVASQFPSWTIYDAAGAAFLPNANILQRDYVFDSTLITGGPAALTKVELTTIAGQTSGTTKLYSLIDRKLKPNTFYGISFWYKIDATWNCRLRAGLNSNNTGSSNSVITTGSPAGQPVDVLTAPDAAWHRASLIVQTKNDGSVSPVNPYYLELRVDAPDPSEFPGGSTAATLSITSVQVQEGEWVTGYMGSQYVPSGGIILWDMTDTCPPGFQEVTSAKDRFPVGANGNVVVGASGGTAFNPGGGATITTSLNGAHTHDINYTPNNAQNGTGESTVDTPTGSSGAHDHSVNINNTLPYYGLLFCRAI